MLVSITVMWLGDIVAQMEWPVVPRRGDAIKLNSYIYFVLGVRYEDSGDGCSVVLFVEPTALSKHLMAHPLKAIQES